MTRHGSFHAHEARWNSFETQQIGRWQRNVFASRMIYTFNCPREVSKNRVCRVWLNREWEIGRSEWGGEKKTAKFNAIRNIPEHRYSSPSRDHFKIWFLVNCVKWLEQESKSEMERRKKNPLPHVIRILPRLCTFKFFCMNMRISSSKKLREIFQLYSSTSCGNPKGGGNPKGQ